MYEFVTHTWNTIKGKCPHGCLYCYVKRWGKQPELHFEERELKTDLGSGNTIFVGSSCDMFADVIPVEWVIKTLLHCEKFDNTYFFQTKNPKGYFEYGAHIAALNKFALCITLETNRWYEEIMNNSPKPIHKVFEFSHIPIKEKFITIEPIMNFDLSELVDIIEICNPLQVNIGADSGRNNLPEPSKEKVLELISELEKFTIVHQKSNLKRILK